MGIPLKSPGAGSKRPKSAGVGQAEKLAKGERRFVANLPASIHQQIRERVTEKQISARTYLLALLKKDGIE